MRTHQRALGGVGPFCQGFVGEFGAFAFGFALGHEAGLLGDSFLAGAEFFLAMPTDPAESRVVEII